VCVCIRLYICTHICNNKHNSVYLTPTIQKHSSVSSFVTRSLLSSLLPPISILLPFSRTWRNPKLLKIGSWTSESKWHPVWVVLLNHGWLNKILIPSIAHKYWVPRAVNYYLLLNKLSRHPSLGHHKNGLQDHTFIQQTPSKPGT
jgi:hypothetical protein